MSSAALCEALEYLMQVKEHKDVCGKDSWYELNKWLAWKEAERAVKNYKELKK